MKINDKVMTPDGPGTITRNGKYPDGTLFREVDGKSGLGFYDDKDLAPACHFDSNGLCQAAVCYSREKCNSRNKDGDPLYDDF